jgi:hypothetical protein
MRRRHVPLTLALLVVAGVAEAAAPPRPSTPAAATAEPAAPLAAFTTAQVRAKLGEPAVASEEGKGALWTYRLEGCALMVFFKDAGRGLRVSSVAASGRKRGDAPPTVETCMAAKAEG